VQIAVPGWMLDPVHCQQLTEEARPRVAVAALCALRALVDSQSGLAATSPDATGGDDAGPPRGSPDAAEADVRPPRGVAQPSRGRATPMCRPGQPTIARRAQGRGGAKESR
jgi:hypothetical protein